MAQGKTITATTPRTSRELKVQAVARVLSRRITPAFTEFPDLRGGGTFRIQTDSRVEFAPAADLDEWIDDRQARCSYGKPAADTLLELLELLRAGPDGVPRAVRLAADRLRSPHDQFAVWMPLSAAPAGPSPVDVMRSRLAREWQAAELAVTPAPTVRLESADWNAPSPEARRVQYRTPLGHNAA